MNIFYNYMSSDSNTNYNPEDIIKKESRGLGDDADFGEVQESWYRTHSNTKGNFR
jgi:hypothetical protein